MLVNSLSWISVPEKNRTQRILSDDICDSGFSRIEDAEFLQKVSASYRKCVMQMQNLQRKYPQVLEKARCRCNLT